jgi:hypothetical protein
MAPSASATTTRKQHQPTRAATAPRLAIVIANHWEGNDLNFSESVCVGYLDDSYCAGQGFLYAMDGSDFVKEKAKLEVK